MQPSPPARIDRRIRLRSGDRTPARGSSRLSPVRRQELPVGVEDATIAACHSPAAGRLTPRLPTSRRRRRLRTRASASSISKPTANARFRPRSSPPPPTSSSRRRSIAINLAVFAAMVARHVSAFAPTTDALKPWGANYGPLTTHGQWWRLVTATFVHIGLTHLLVNMFALFVIGQLHRAAVRQHRLPGPLPARRHRRVADQPVDPPARSSRPARRARSSRSTAA